MSELAVSGGEAKFSSLHICICGLKRPKFFLWRILGYFWSLASGKKNTMNKLAPKNHFLKYKTGEDILDVDDSK